MYCFQAPSRHRVIIQFSSDFGIFRRNKVCVDWVEVKFLENLGLNGYRYCGNNAPKDPIRSIGNVALITFRASYVNNRHLRRSFQILCTAQKESDISID